MCPATRVGKGGVIPNPISVSCPHACRLITLIAYSLLHASEAVMGRVTKQNRVVLSVWVTEAGRDRLDRIATECGVPRAEVLRRALAAGTEPAQVALKKEAAARKDGQAW